MTTRSFWLFCSIVSCWSGALGCGEAPIGNLVASRQAALVGASSPIVFAVESSHRALFRRDGTVFYNKSGGAGGGRGFNVAAIDPQTGNLLEPVRNFDTWGSRNSGTAHRALITYLDGVADGTLLLFAVADEAGLTGWNASRCVRLRRTHVFSLLAKLEALGSRRIADYCYRDRWAMAAIKGQGAPLIEQLGEDSTSTSIELSFTPGSGA